MFTYKNAPYKIFALGPKFCWAGPDNMHVRSLGIYYRKILAFEHNII